MVVACGAPPADRFLRLACLTYSDDERADRAAAAQLLAQHPDLPGRDLFVAAACADAVQLRRHLAVRPSAATGTGGPHGWSPLLYQAYARHNPGIDRATTLETARLLLEAGADPNDGRFWHALPTPFTVLTGVLGYGEQRQPWHPHATEFARLLLDAGADPNDGQALYNRMFGANDEHLVLLFEYGLGRDTHGPWRSAGEPARPRCRSSRASPWCCSSPTRCHGSPHASGTRPEPGGTDIYINPADFASVYAGGLSPAQVAIASVVQRPITAAALGEATTVDPPAATPKWEIVALQDNAIPTKAEFFMAARAHANVVTVNSGHDVPAAAPQVIDSVILRAAQSAG